MLRATRPAPLPIFAAAQMRRLGLTCSSSSDTREVWDASEVTRLYTSTRSPMPLQAVVEVNTEEASADAQVTHNS